MIELGAFDFSKNGNDVEVLELLAHYGEANCEAALREAWGDAGFEAWAEETKFYEVKQGIYHGTVDRTAEIREYLAKMEPANPDAPEMEGCVKVDAKLAELLQQLMDRYTFEGVEDSWRKLCYYWKLYTPESPSVSTAPLS